MKINRTKLLFLFLICLTGSILALTPDSFSYLNDFSDTSISSAPDRRTAANIQISESRSTVITETVKKVSPAVVGINVTEIKQYQDPFSSLWGDDPFWRQFFGGRSYNQEVKSLGSGTIISPDGYILTNDHVAGNGIKIVVTMTNGMHYTAKIVGTDPASDICLLKIEGKNLPYIPLGTSSDVMIGEWVIALGNPFGLFEINDQPTVTVGVISAKGMNLDPVNNRYYLNMLQTDAAINGGNSGGPLINSIGQLIGMNTLIYTAGGSQGNIGLGFAIPIDKIKSVIEDLKQKGSVDRNFWIGMRVQSIDEGIASYYKLPSNRGVIVTYIEKNSPAEKAGLEVGDIITEVENNKITNDQSLIGEFQEFRTGQTIDLSIIRDNNKSNKKMKLERKND